VLPSENCVRPLYRFPAKEFFCIAVSILAVASISVRAGEPVTPAATTNFLAGGSTPCLASLACVTQNLYLLLDNSQPATASTNSEPVELVATNGATEAQTNLVPDDSLQLTRGSLHPGKQLTVEAGYGRMWDETSMLQKLCSDYQDPGYAYVSAHFSF